MVFLFPSTGTAFLNLGCVCAGIPQFRVSIPFKRDGVSERFNFNLGVNCLGFVSIPFKRDGVSERYAFEPLCARVSKAQIQTRFKSGRFFGRRFCENTQEPLSSFRY